MMLGGLIIMTDIGLAFNTQMNLDQAGDALIDIMVRVCNGRNTCAEALGHREFVMTRLFESA